MTYCLLEYNIVYKKHNTVCKTSKFFIDLDTNLTLKLDLTLNKHIFLLGSYGRSTHHSLTKSWGNCTCNTIKQKPTC